MIAHDVMLAYLHPTDVAKLLTLLQRLVSEGHTVVIIGHHLELIASADYLIDIGPEAGTGGGTVVAVGPPEVIAASRIRRTGPFLAKLLK